MKLSHFINAKVDQWSREAELRIASHGQAGGEFATEKWANGRIMVGPVGSLANQCIPAERFEEIKAAGWKIFSGSRAFELA